MTLEGFKDPDFKKGQWVEHKNGLFLLIMNHTGWDGAGSPRYDVGGWRNGEWFERNCPETNLQSIKDTDAVIVELRVPTWQERLAWLEKVYKTLPPYWTAPLVEALYRAALRFDLTGESQFLLLKSPSNELGEGQIPLFVCEQADEATKTQFNALWDAQADKTISEIAKSMTKYHESNGSE